LSSLANEVSGLLIKYLPNLAFKPHELRMFPKEITDEVLAHLREAGMPPGYEID